MGHEGRECTSLSPLCVRTATSRYGTMALQQWRSVRELRPRSCRTFRNRWQLEAALQVWRTMMQNDSSDAGPMCPTTAAEALGSSSSWSASSCGVDIRRCLDDRAKGMGAFATRHIRASSMVGCYWGEWLTRREGTLVL